MRVSTGMIYDAGVASIQRQTSALMHTQQQVASGRRIVTPSDDPVAAARILEVEQARESNAQYLVNQKAAGETLGLVEGNLVSAGNLLTRVRELAVLAGNASLADSDRRSIAIELRSRFDELLGIANATDGAGQYLFSGYQGATTPFSGAVGSGVGYAGDDGQRKLQVSASRQLAVSESGRDVFMRVRAGNGTFGTSAAVGNAGTGVIDGGDVLNPAGWAAGGVPATGLKIVFSVVGATRFYDIQDAATSTSLLTAPIAHVSGQAIPLLKQTAPAADYGAQVVVTGQPANGDTFTITPSGTQSMFATIENLIAAVEAPLAAGAGNVLLTNRIGSALTNLDQATDNLLRVRASIGAGMQELDALASAGEDLGLQYQQVLSRLQDVDYAAAITELTQQQSYLEAAQKSFLRVSGLSLFNYV